MLHEEGNKENQTEGTKAQTAPDKVLEVIKGSNDGVDNANDFKEDRSQSETGVQCIAQIEKVWQDQVCQAGYSHGGLISLKRTNNCLCFVNRTPYFLLKYQITVKIY